MDTHEGSLSPKKSNINNEVLSIYKTFSSQASAAFGKKGKKNLS
jgi:hypothetical protein